MKVIVTTLHHVRNYGSLLQTYATQKTIEKLGHSCEIVDYIPRGLTLKYGILTIKSQGNFVKDIARKSAAALFFSIQQATMIRFLKKNVTLSKKTYSTYADLKNSPPVADAYISGSDQIWNTQNYNLPDDVKGYYLQYVPQGKIKLAYASSIGKDEFSAEEKACVKEYLKDFKAISVREKSAVSMLDEIGVKDAVHVLDPTLLLTKEEWLEFLGEHKKEKEPFIFVYNLNRNVHVKNFALKLAKEKGLKIINFSDTLDFMSGADNRIHNTVFDFLYYLANAEYIVTDSFHGTAFSVNLGKQFVSFAAPRFNSRLLSILELFELQDRFLTEFDGTVDVIYKEIDREKVERKLQSERARCTDYLDKNLRYD